MRTATKLMSGVLGSAGTSVPANVVTFNGQAVTSADNGGATVTYTQGS